MEALLRETRHADPVTAIREKAAALLGQFHTVFGGAPPFDMEALASFRGLRSATEAPRYSDDSELAPQPDGSVVLRVNREKPLTRQRFSVGHEVGHTLFKDFELEVRCRKGIGPGGSEPKDEIEALCDVAASEFLFPSPWFSGRAKRLSLSAEEILRLASEYAASREATLRRLIEVRTEPLAVVFFSWKLKPTELRATALRRTSVPLFKSAIAAPAPKLRVDYGLANDAFNSEYGGYIAKDKSVPSCGPIYEASRYEIAADAHLKLDLGSISGVYDVCAFPVFTPDDAPARMHGSSVAALLSPA